MIIIFVVGVEKNKFMKPLAKSCSLHFNKVVSAQNTHSVRVVGVADRARHREVCDSGHLHSDYLFSGMQRKTAPHRSKREHRKLISMRFRLRQRVRRLGETEQMGVRLREASRHSQLNKAPHIPSPPPHPPPGLGLCVYALLLVCDRHVCVSVRPYILNHVTWHEQSCSQCEKHHYI